MDRKDWNERYAAQELLWGAEPNRFLAEELRDVPAHGRALDIACGEGRNAIWLEADVMSFAPVAGAFQLVIIASLHLPEASRRTVLAHAVSALGRGGTLFMIGHARLKRAERKAISPSRTVSSPAVG
ncbi:MAG TPA: hypothetical protein VMW56_01065 [Candidatus Margulisiibacteriota bacterium]|nr:hypothetical protein [Candidatus Margulisiibacteriota bacterium]